MSSIFAGRKFFLSKNLPVYELDRVSQILIKEGATISYKYELDNIYVIHDFEQEEFQELWRQLRQQGVTHPPIVGVPCIEQSVELKKPLPPPEKFPLFMRIFEGIVICFSGFLKEEQYRLSYLSELMGAKTSKPLSSEVTHLVVNRVGSLKYITALQANMKIVSKEWIIHCWKQRSLQPVSKYYVGPFFGLIICISGIVPFEERHRIKTLTEENGGKYKGDLDKQCTHLVVDKQKLVSDQNSKYAYALKWGIKVVEKQWFFECLNQKRWVDEEQFRIRDPLFEKSDVEKNNNILKTNQLQHAAEYGQNKLSGNLPAKYCLSTCYIYLSGIYGPRLEKYKTVVQQLGGHLSETITPQVTHIVSDNFDEKDFQMARTLRNPNMCIVSLRWLQECYTNKRLIPSEPYLIEHYKSSKDSEESREQKRKTLDMEEPTVTKRLHLVDSTNEKVNSHTVPASRQPSEFPNNETTQLFRDIHIFCFGFKKENEVRALLEKNGAIVYDNYALTSLKETKGEMPPIHYIVAPHGITVACEYFDVIRQPPVVSLQWIEACVEERRIIDPKTNEVLYRPLPFPLPYYSKFMSNFFLCTSGFTEHEKQELETLAILLGAKYTAALKPNITTHLICKEPKGPKFETALKANIRVVTKQWLEECARRGYKVDEAQFSFFSAVHIIDDQNIGNTKNNENGNPNHEYGTERAEDKEGNGMRTLAQTSTTLPPPLNNSPKTDITHEYAQQEQLRSDKLQLLPTEPANKNNLEDSENNEPDILLTPDLITVSSQSSLKDNQNKTETTLTSKNDKTIPGQNLDPIHKHEVLSGVTIFVHQRLSDQTAELQEIAVDLGAQYSWQLDNSVTHIIYQGKVENNKTLSRARKRGVFIVSPTWLRQCKTEKRRFSEHLFPPSMKPNLTLGNLITSVSTSTSAVPRSPQLSIVNCTLNNTTSKPQNKRKNELVTTSKSKGEATKFPSPPASPSHDLTPPQHTIRISAEATDPGTKLISNFSSSVRSHYVANLSRKSQACSKTVKYNSKLLAERMSPRTSIHTNNDIALIHDDSSRTSTGTNEKSDAGTDSNTQKLVTALSDAINHLPKITTQKVNRKPNNEQLRNSSKRLSRTELMHDHSQAITKNGSTSTPLSNSEKIKPNEEDDEKSQIIAYKSDLKDQRELEMFLQHLEGCLPTHPPENVVANAAFDVQSKPFEIKDNEIIAVERNLEKFSVHHYTDASSSIQKENIIVSQSPNNDNVIQTPTIITATNIEGNVSNQYRIILSSIDDKEQKEEIMKQIKLLGGTPMKHFDNTCTHIIASKPMRSEKYLGACALGLWVLKPSWLSESLKTGKFVSEEPHQWSSTDTTNPKEKELFDAPKRWRIRLKQENKRGAFEGWNVVLYVTKKREKGLCKVLQAGGAHIVATSPPFTRLENVTLAFVEKSLLNDVQQINCLQQQGILCYTAEYINDYLITEKPFNPSTYQVHIRDLNHKPDDNHQIKKKSSNHNIQSSSEQIRSRAKEHNGCNQMS